MGIISTQKITNKINEIAQDSAKEEEDSPITKLNKDNISVDEQKIGLEKLKEQIKASEVKEKRKYAFHIICICFVGVGIIIIGENIFSVLNINGASNLNNLVFELLKSILLIVIGYLFGKSEA